MWSEVLRWVIFVVYVGVLGWIARLGWANWRTERQRSDLIAFLYRPHNLYNGELDALQYCWSCVRYDQHLKAVFWGSDPYALYGYLGERFKYEWVKLSESQKRILRNM